jgi:hypothetical protein
MPTRFLCRFFPRSFKKQAYRNRHTTNDHDELLSAFIKDADDAIGPRTVLLSSDAQPDEVGNPYIDENEDQPHGQRTTPGATCRVEMYPGAGSSKGASSGFEEYAGYSLENPRAPFADVEEFKLVQWFIQSGAPKNKIDDYYNAGLGSSGDGRATSAAIMWKKIDSMEKSRDMRFEEKVIDYSVPGVGETRLFYRDPVKCVEYLLRQPAFASKMVWGPIKEFSSNGKRLYSEMHTGDWWWEEQVNLTCSYKVGDS